MTLMQTAIAAVGTDPGSAILLTLVFALAPILLGAWALLVAFRERIGAGEQIAMAVLVISPLFAFIAAVMPARRRLRE